MTTQTQYEISRVVLRQLAQSRPSSTAIVSIYSPGDGIEATVKRVVVCNTSAGAAAASFYHDDDGTTYDESTQLYKNRTITASTTWVFATLWHVDSSGNIAVKTDVNSALTFTLYGDETQVRAR